MNIIMITTLSRPELLKQSLDSLEKNATNWDSHHLTLVVDSATSEYVYRYMIPAAVLVKLSGKMGASRARNIGAGSIPKHARQRHVMFLDDDVWMAPEWDKRMEMLLGDQRSSICSPYGHPFNQEEEITGITYARFPLVISSVAMAMSWEAFDRFGPWDEPGGPGASEDYALCMRAKEGGYGFAVKRPHCCLHTGLTNSKGEPIVGADLEREQNEKLLEFYGMQGKVIFQ